MAEGLGDDEDVGKQNRCVDAGEPAQGLQCDFGCERGSLDHVEERRLSLERTIFRQVAAGLAHDPEGRAIKWLAGEGGEKAFA